MKRLLQRIAERFNEWRARRDFARLSPEYRKLFTAMGIDPKTRCGIHTGGLLDCQYDIKGSCSFSAGKGVRCVSQKISS